MYSRKVIVVLMVILLFTTINPFNGYALEKNSIEQEKIKKEYKDLKEDQDIESSFNIEEDLEKEDLEKDQNDIEVEINADLDLAETTIESSSDSENEQDTEGIQQGNEGYESDSVVDESTDEIEMESNVVQEDVDDALSAQENVEKIQSLDATNIDPTNFKKGMEHEKILDVKKKLNKLGFNGIAVKTGYFGPHTERRVKEFQEYYGLKVDGVIGPETFKKVEEIISHPLQNGKKHDSLISLKQRLNRLGYSGIAISPTFGPFTEKQVKAFQKDHNLPVSGIIEYRTRDAINNAYEDTFTEGNRHKGITELKRNLNKLGFDGLAIADLYGSFTTKRVKEFQSYYGLKATGNADLNTLNKIDEILSHPLQNGKKHDNLIAIKQKLNRLGYSGISISPTFGPFTEKQVKAFQKDHKLPVSGIIEDKTKAKIDDVFLLTYQEGGRHKGVTQLKRNLNRLGFNGLAIADYYGAFTTKRVKEFQSYYGLKATGIADLETLNKVDEILSHPLQNGESNKESSILKKNLNKLGFNGLSSSNVFGNYTEKRLKEFQAHYGLTVNGIGDDPTLAQVDKILSSPFQVGKSHKDTKELKRHLNTLGYSGIKITEFFGDFTEKRLKEFQKDHGLPISGIADDITWIKINELVDKYEPEKPKEDTTYTNYDVTLNESLNIQMNQLQQTDKYRNDPAYVSAQYVEITDHSIINSTGNVNLRTSPSLKNNDNVAKSAKNGDKVTILEEVTGDSYNGSTKWYKINYKDEKTTLYVHSSLVSTSTTAKVTANLNVRAKQNANSHIFGTLSKGTVVTIVAKLDGWYQIKYQTWRNPTRSDVEGYLNPSNNDKFQHLVLSSSVNVSASELNKVLAGKGILDGLGQAFIDGGKEHSVNEIYLISHAFLESGNGTSKLATGVEVGKNKSGNLVLVTTSNRNSLTAIKTTYNMFGIGAADADPLRLGAIHAYKEGWFTPKDAVIGGAKFIGDRYIHNKYKQNTLYKMRWNPANPGYPQYATDIGWAVKQTTNIKNMYNQLTNPSLHFDIPKYK